MGNPQEEATALKNKGNDAFKNQDWPAALEYYTKAIELWDKEPSFYTNRAQVRKRQAAAHGHLLTPLVRQTSSSNRMDMQWQMPTRPSQSIRTMSR
jgi:tetratricopeptide (TPR) repeat protein